MRARLSLHLHHYWTALCAGRPMPARGDVDPSALRTVLPDLFILEMLPDQDIRFRLAGTRVCLVFGRELRGQSFDSIWRNDQARQTAHVVRRILDSGQPARLDARAETRLGDRLRLHMPLFPLTDKDGQPTRMLGALDIEALPFPEALLPVSHIEQTGLLPLRPDDLAASAASRLVPSSATPDDRPSRDTMRQVRHLSIMDGGRVKI